MKSTDRFLIGIVAGVIALVVIAFAVAYLRPAPAYRAGSEPADVAHNYLLALQQGDYERAYGYLLPSLPGYPDSAEAFAEHTRKYTWNIRPDDLSATLQVEDARLTGNRATVRVRETRFNQNGLFQSEQYQSTFEVRLLRSQGVWRISGADSFWVWCWDNRGGCE